MYLNLFFCMAIYLHGIIEGLIVTHYDDNNQFEILSELVKSVQFFFLALIQLDYILYSHKDQDR